MASKLPTFYPVAVLLIAATSLAGCGGGGGGDSSTAESMTYSATVTGMDLRLQSNNSSIDSGGLPIDSSTVTRNPR
jgi:hypothetical protein